MSNHRPRRPPGRGVLFVASLWASLIAFLAFAALVRGAEAQGIGEAFTCKVSRIVDGDTWDCEGGRRIRAGGWNTPELARFGKPNEPGAERARDFLTIILLGRELSCVGTGESHDRVVASCSLDLGEIMVGAGLATDCPPFSDGRYAHLDTWGLPRASFCR